MFDVDKISSFIISIEEAYSIKSRWLAQIELEIYEPQNKVLWIDVADLALRNCCL